MTILVTWKHLLIISVIILKTNAVPDLVQLNTRGDDENKFGTMIEFAGDKFEDGRVEAENEDFVGNGISKNIHEIVEQNQRGILNNLQFFGQPFVRNNDGFIQSLIKVHYNGFFSIGVESTQQASRMTCPLNSITRTIAGRKITIFRFVGNYIAPYWMRYIQGTVHSFVLPGGHRARDLIYTDLTQGGLLRNTPQQRNDFIRRAQIIVITWLKMRSSGSRSGLRFTRGKLNTFQTFLIAYDGQTFVQFYHRSLDTNRITVGAQKCIAVIGFSRDSDEVRGRPRFQFPFGTDRLLDLFHNVPQSVEYYSDENPFVDIGSYVFSLNRNLVRQPQEKDADCRNVNNNFKCSYRVEAIKAVEEKAAQSGKRKRRDAQAGGYYYHSKTPLTTTQNQLTTVVPTKITTHPTTHPRTTKGRQITTDTLVRKTTTTTRLSDRTTSGDMMTNRTTEGTLGNTTDDTGGSGNTTDATGGSGNTTDAMGGNGGTTDDTGGSGNTTDDMGGNGGTTDDMGGNGGTTDDDRTENEILADRFCEFRDEGLFAYTVNCQAYVECVGEEIRRRAIFKACDRGQHFHPDILNCVPANQFTCFNALQKNPHEDPYLPPGVSPFPRPEVCNATFNDGNIADPESCSRYYTCTSGLTIGPRPCSTSLYFNPRIGNCDWPKNVNTENCRGATIRTTTTTTRRTTIKDDSTTMKLNTTTTTRRTTTTTRRTTLQTRETTTSTKAKTVPTDIIFA